MTKNLIIEIYVITLTLFRKRKGEENEIKKTLIKRIGYYYDD